MFLNFLEAAKCQVASYSGDIQRKFSPGSGTDPVLEGILGYYRTRAIRMPKKQKGMVLRRQLYVVFQFKCWVLLGKEQAEAP